MSRNVLVEAGAKSEGEVTATGLEPRFQLVTSPSEKLSKSKQKQQNTQGKKQVEALEMPKPTAQKLTIKDVILENVVKEKAKDELNKIKEIKKQQIEKMNG